MGNVGSVFNMLKKIGGNPFFAQTPEDIKGADKLILPGVGYFDTGMTKLEKSGLAEAIRDHALTQGKPVLGICLGMQMLGRKSEEGTLPGLCLIEFDNIRFQIPAEKGLKIPHMGWNRVAVKADTPLTTGLSDKERYYFVHSYHAVCDDPANTLMTSEYGYEFTAAVHSGSVYGVQFHPEKSHEFGMRVLKNFMEC
jgi:glutamine amidotransferase